MSTNDGMGGRGRAAEEEEMRAMREARRGRRCRGREEETEATGALARRRRGRVRRPEENRRQNKAKGMV